MLARCVCDKPGESRDIHEGDCEWILTPASISRNITKLKIITLTSSRPTRHTPSMGADSRERANASEPAERSGDSGVPASEAVRGSAGAQPPGSKTDRLLI